jgi:L-fuculose-phosphate aldolase
MSALDMALAEEIVEVCRRLHARNLLAAADGNVSFRKSDEEILFTPTGVNKAWMRPEEMAVVTLDNRVLRGQPSGERLMHLEIYRQCPQAKAVVHAHPPTAIAWTVARPELTELPAESLSELILAVGSVPIAPYARPGTQTMGDVLKPLLPRSRVMLLARHGAVSWGESLAEAYNGMERVEHCAQILKSAVELGGLSRLPDQELKALRELRARLGERSL